MNSDIFEQALKRAVEELYIYEEEAYVLRKWHYAHERVAELMTRHERDWAVRIMRRIAKKKPVYDEGDDRIYAISWYDLMKSLRSSNEIIGRLHVKSNFYHPDNDINELFSAFLEEERMKEEIERQIERERQLRADILRELGLDPDEYLEDVTDEILNGDDDR